MNYETILLNFDCSMAESKGFEPLRQLLTIYMISNHAPSASRTTLQAKRAQYSFSLNEILRQ